MDATTKSRIRRMKKQGYKQTKIAERLGISNSVVYQECLKLRREKVAADKKAKAKAPANEMKDTAKWLISLGYDPEVVRANFGLDSTRAGH